MMNSNQYSNTIQKLNVHLHKQKLQLNQSKFSQNNKTEMHICFTASDLMNAKGKWNFVGKTDEKKNQLEKSITEPIMERYTE